MSAQGKRKARRRHDSRVGSGDERHHGSEGDKPETDLAESRFECGVGKRRQRSGKFIRRHYADRDDKPADVNQSHRDDSPQHSGGDVADRAFHLFRDAGDVKQSAECNEDERRQCHDFADVGFSVEEKRCEPGWFDHRDSEYDKCAHRSQQDKHHNVLCPRGGIGSDQIYKQEKHGHCNAARNAGQTPQLIQQFGHAEDRKRTFQGDRRPVQQAGNCSGERSQTAFGIIVDPAGERHGGRQFDRRQRSDAGGDSGKQISQNHRRTHFFKCNTRKNKDSGADHGSGCDAEHIQKPQCFQ